MFTIIVFVSLAAYTLWTWVCLERNMRRASSLGVPCVRLPIDSNNIIWQIFEPHLWKIVDGLPFSWASYPASIRHLRRGWHFYEKASHHTRLGPIWALVSPVKINLHIADPGAIGHIFSHRRDFVRPIESYKILEVYGPCISTADSDNWARHRKALAAPFNESIMSFVWDETVRQSHDMLESWTKPNTRQNGIPSVQQDTRSLSLNILAATGFRKSYKFIGSADNSTVEEGTYRHALQTILDNSIAVMVIPYKVLMFPLMPKRWARIGQASESFRNYMTEMLHEEMKAHKLKQKGSGGIMSSLIHALDAYQYERSLKDHTGNTPGTLAKGLSVEEIFGNIYVINFAGHDTTANTLAFAMLLLVDKPEVQEWIWEEIQDLMKGLQLEPGSYDELFPKLLRCRAVLYETLRLYPPIMALPKGTDHRSQSLNVQGKHIEVPPNTVTTLSLLACHTHPDTWPDPLDWKPSRWILSSPQGEKFYTPPKYTYFPWSDGPQDCPGKKFAEVEFVAALAYLFRKDRLKVKANDGESASDSQDRVRKTINDVNQELLLRMKDADAVRLVCVPR